MLSIARCSWVHSQTQPCSGLVGFLDGHIISFDQFSKLFREQFFVNQANPLILYELFNVKQRRGKVEVPSKA